MEVGLSESINSDADTIAARVGVRQCLLPFDRGGVTALSARFEDILNVH